MTTEDTNLPATFKIEDKLSEKFKTILLEIDLISDKDFGSYFVVNDKGTSLQGFLNKIVDGQWGDWGPWGNCSKPCITGQGTKSIAKDTLEGLDVLLPNQIQARNSKLHFYLQEMKPQARRARKGFVLLLSMVASTAQGKVRRIKGALVTTTVS